ncbi:MAG: hypothetical protein Kow00109_01190 [Acidobacteriota bacterium]
MTFRRDERDFRVFRKLVEDSSHRVGVFVGESVIAQAWTYYEELRRWNRAVRLTGAEQMERFVPYHLVEAFWVATHFLEGCRAVADIGSGAGLPGLAAAILKPEVSWYLLESNLKKATFLEETSRKLALPAQVVAGRAESWTGWPGVDRAFVRGLRLSEPLLHVLENHLVSLGCLCGAACFPPRDRWRVFRRETYPLAKARFCVLAEPRRPPVPRGT